MVRPAKFEIKIAIISLAIGFWALSGVAPASAQVGETYAIKAGKIITVTNDTISNGVIIIRKGLIESVGPGLKMPPDAEVLEADSMWVYPGFIDSYTSVAIKKKKTEQNNQQSGQRRSTSQQSTVETNLKPEIDAVHLLDPKDARIAKMREIGVTTVLSVPDQGIFRGHSALINLGGDSYGDMVIKSPVAEHLTYTRNRSGYPSTLMGVIAFQRQTFFDAQHHQSLWARYNRQKRGIPRPEVNESLDALLPVLQGKMPIIISANTENEIKRAVKLAKEFGLRYLISGAIEGWRVVDLLIAEKKPLLVSVNYPKPENVTGYSYKLKIDVPKKAGSKTAKKDQKKKEVDPELAEIYANAAKLKNAGLKFAFTSVNMKKPEELIKNIRKAVEQGLAKEDALKALTLNPAQIFAVSDQLGSIEEGKIANLVVSTGDIFAEKTTIKYVFVDGKKFEMKEKKKASGEAEVNISGTWDAMVESPQGEIPITLKFTQEGSNLTGTFSSEFGSADIYDGSVSGSELQFRVKITIQGQIMDLQFEGRVEGNTIEGTIDLGEMGTTSWSATKPGH